MSKLIELEGRKYKREVSTLGCAGCAALLVRNEVDCNKINDAAHQQHEMANCVSMGNIYVEVSGE